MFSSVVARPDLQQHSILFHQAAQVGLSHAATLRHILSSACRRASLPTLDPPEVTDWNESPLSDRCKLALGYLQWALSCMSAALALVGSDSQNPAVSNSIIMGRIVSDHAGESACSQGSYHVLPALFCISTGDVPLPILGYGHASHPDNARRFQH